MTRTDLQMEKAGPLWAVLGAPLVGVPLMVAVLALGSGTAVDAALEPELGSAVEQVEAVESVETTPDQDARGLHDD